MLTGTRSMAFGLTEPDHGSDATWMETTAVRDGDSWVINGAKRWNTGVHRATHDLVFARTSVRTAQRWYHRIPGAHRHRVSRCPSTGGRSTCRPTTARSR